MDMFNMVRSHAWKIEWQFLLAIMEKKFVRIDTLNKKLSYCDAEMNLILSFDKVNNATIVFSDKYNH